MDRFQETYGAKYPTATEKLLEDREALLAHFEYGAEHWLHLSPNASPIRKPVAPSRTQGRYDPVSRLASKRTSSSAFDSAHISR